MRDNDGRKLDHATLEVMRIRACRQLENGAHPEDVAADLASIGRRSSDGSGRTGRAARRRCRASRFRVGPKLTKAQMSTLIVGSNPAQYQLDFALWTRDLVRQVIAKSGDGPLDDVTRLVDGGVEFFLPVEEFSAVSAGGSN
ncbi:MAG: hypothetical protein GEU71_19095 [Actinobacteria bacterium]|nr:hypothetical protein [Actinomycetota bacterium]